MPFDLLPYWDDDALDALLPPQKGRAAYVELHNLIASAERPTDYGPSDLVRIGRRHGVDLRRHFERERLGLYAHFLHHALVEGRFTEQERDTLAHLAHTLHLDAATLKPLHEEAFGRTVSAALADDCLSVDDRLLLYTLQHTLGLGDAADAAYEATARERLLVTVARALCDGELSPEEADEIEALEKALDIRAPERVDKMLHSAAHRWRIHHGPLPNVEVGVRLLPGEVGHLSTEGRWREVNYARLRVLLKDHRDLLHRGETAALHIPDKALVGRRWHEGRLTVTSKRLLLIRHGESPVVYALVAIVGAERYRNGIRVSVKGDRSFLIDAGPANKTLYSVLWRALHPGRTLSDGE